VSKAQRDKGRRGQAQAKELLSSRDWDVVETNAGISQEDFLAKDANGRYWCVEVKNTVSITEAHRKQAMEQAVKRKLPWMLVSKITGTGSWLIQRKGEKPVVWSESNE
jgi:hypothetical protein